MSNDMLHKEAVTPDLAHNPASTENETAHSENQPLETECVIQGERLTCLSCGTSGQPLNRLRCWNCGKVFSKAPMRIEKAESSYTEVKAPAFDSRVYETASDESVKKKRKTHVTNMIGAVILLCWDFGMLLYYKKYISSLWFLFVIFALIGFGSLCIRGLALSKCDAIIRNRSTSKLIVDESGVSGMSFTSVESTPQEFKIPYREIVSVQRTSGELNLQIVTKEETYKCLDLMHGAEAERVILERRDWVVAGHDAQ